MMSKARIAATVLGLLSLLLLRQAVAEDYRIRTRVYDADGEEIAAALTLFRGSRVYDFVDDPAEAIVFEQSRQRFLVVAPDLRLATEVTCKQIEEFLSRARAAALKRAEKLEQESNQLLREEGRRLRFLLQPRFDRQFDDKTNTLRFTSPLLTYRVRAVPAPSLVVARRWREYADWQSRLNSLLQPGGMPPYPRLMINAAVGDAGGLPAEVELQVAQKERTVRLRTAHEIDWELTDGDLERLTRTARQLNDFPQISFTVYRQRLAATSGSDESKTK